MMDGKTRPTITEKVMDARRLAVAVLDRVFRTDGYADVILDAHFTEAGLSSRDRALASEIVYGTLRWKKWLDYMLGHAYHKDWSEMPARVRLILEVGLYQILFLTRIPAYAAVNESVKAVIDEKGRAWGPVVNAVLRAIIRNPDLRTPPPMDENPVRGIAVRWSHPEWLVQRWIDLWGVERTRSLCRANNQRPTMGIRVNRVKGTEDNVLEAIRGCGVDAKPSDFLDEFFAVTKGGDLLRSSAFDDGLFSVQDESAGFVGKLMDPQPGERIVDLTAAPGGKAMHMAELAYDRLMVVAVDVHPTRVLKIRENRERLGLKSIHPVVADGRRFGIKAVDKVLVDAPCSGLGVIRRRGELRWRRKPRDISKMVTIQKELLKSGAAMLKKDGVLVYSTCTILPEENADVVNHFLQKNPDFTVEKAHSFVDPRVVSPQGFVETWPDRHGMDGSFAVRFRRVV
jgi:16S rRNA (cytosine967-C5)-methyltransferase